MRSLIYVFTLRHIMSTTLNSIAQTKMTQKPRVCIIGCGPSGMSALYHMSQLPEEKRPGVVCYEKQSTWGGLWNLTWRTGTDEYGEPVHSSMYPHLWANLPKECMEYYDYTWDDHLGKALPSYAPVKVIKSYLEGRMRSGNKRDLKSFVRFSTVVRRVEYHKASDTFSVTVHNLVEDKEESITNFTHVIVASGIFSVANAPEFPGMDVFKGRILHSHDFRDVSMFLGKTVLIVGAGRSAEDLAVAGIKFGADKIICAWNTKPMGYKWPVSVEERPIVDRFDENTAYFKDGSSAKIDAVILCTGYNKHYPFLPDELRLKTKLPVPFYPDNLYKGTVWMKGGNGKLIYLGAQNAAYTFPLFEVQAAWACKYITGDINLPAEIEMLQDIKIWKQIQDLCVILHDYIDFQTEYIRDLCILTGYVTKVTETRDFYYDVLRHKAENICTFRNKQFASVYTGTLAAKPQIPWMAAFDPSYEAFLKQNQ